MPSPKTRYSPEIREQTAEFILSSGRSATGIAEEMGIDVNTVCKWVREYRRSHDMPTYAQEKGIRTPNPASTAEFRQKTKDTRRERAPELLPDLLPKYMVTVGTRW